MGIVMMTACGRFNFDPLGASSDARSDSLGPRDGAAGCIERLAPGHRHTCAVRYDGSMTCWGANDQGGDGSRFGLGASSWGAETPGGGTPGA